MYCMDYSGNNYHIPNDLVPEFYALLDRIEDFPVDPENEELAEGKLQAEEKFRLFIQNLNK